MVHWRNTCSFQKQTLEGRCKTAVLRYQADENYYTFFFKDMEELEKLLKDLLAHGVSEMIKQEEK